MKFIKVVVSFLFMLHLTLLQAALSDISLTTLSGEELTLEKMAGNKRFMVIIAQGIECPVMRKNIPAFNTLFDKYSDKVGFVLLNGVKGEDLATIKKESEDYQVKIPILKDPKQDLLKELGLKILSGVALVDLKENRILYIGAVDDRVNLDVAKPVAKNKYLEDALISVLNGKPIKIAKTTIYGCSISFK